MYEEPNLCEAVTIIQLGTEWNVDTLIYLYSYSGNRILTFFFIFQLASYLAS